MSLKRNSGVSILEVMISSSIFVICLSMALTSLVTTMKISTRTQQLDITHSRLNRSTTWMNQVISASYMTPRVYTSDALAAEGVQGDELRVITALYTGTLENSPNPNTKMLKLQNLSTRGRPAATSVLTGTPSSGIVTDISQEPIATTTVIPDVQAGDRIELLGALGKWQSSVASVNGKNADKIVVILEDSLLEGFPIGTKVLIGKECRMKVSGTNLITFYPSQNSSSKVIASLNSANQKPFAMSQKFVDLNLALSVGGQTNIVWKRKISRPN